MKQNEKEQRIKTALLSCIPCVDDAPNIGIVTSSHFLKHWLIHALRENKTKPEIRLQRKRIKKRKNDEVKKKNILCRRQYNTTYK
jgi:hypothetical protein